MSVRIWIMAVVAGSVVAWSVELPSAQAAQGVRQPGARPAGNPNAGKKPAVPKPPPKQKEKYRGEGVIESIKPGSIVMKERKGDARISLDLGNKAKVRVTGTVERNYLKVGQLLQFSALVNNDKKSRKIKDPVKSLLLFTENQQYTPGCFPDMSNPPALAGAGDDPSVIWKPYIVAGQIVSIKDNKLQLSVRDLSPRLSIDLADDVRITFNVGDLSLARPGDTIMVSKANKLDADRVTVTEATIKRSDPLGASPKSTEK